MAYESPSFGSRTLSVGVSGNDVRELKIRLNALGYKPSNAGDSATATSFNSDTDTTVRAFQQQQGLTVDGIVGPLTRDALNQTFTTWGITTLSSSTAANNPRAVRELQRRLKLWGYYSGSVDGVWTSALTQAVQGYQSYHNLTADGIVGPITYSRLIETKVAYDRTVTIPLSFLELVCQYSTMYGLSPYHVCAVVDLESNWNRCNVSTASAYGLMQLLCSTAVGEGYSGTCPGTCAGNTGLFNADVNVHYGCSYINRFFDGASGQWPCVANTITSYKWGTPTIDATYLNNVLQRLFYYGDLVGAEQHP